MNVMGGMSVLVSFSHTSKMAIASAELMKSMDTVSRGIFKISINKLNPDVSKKLLYYLLEHVLMKPSTNTDSDLPCKPFSSC